MPFLNLLDLSQPPALLDLSDIDQTTLLPTPYELGTVFRLEFPAKVMSLVFWKSPQETGTHTVKIWRNTGDLLFSQVVESEPDEGLVEVLLPQPVQLEQMTNYTVSVNINTHYVITNSYFVSPAFPQNLPGGVTLEQNAGVYGVPGEKPASSFQGSNYFVGCMLDIGDAPATLRTKTLFVSVGSNKPDIPVAYTILGDERVTLEAFKTFTDSNGVSLNRLFLPAELDIAPVVVTATFIVPELNNPE